MKKSMIETAYEIEQQHNGPMPFTELWKEVAEKMGYTPRQQENNIARFFTDLSIDGRFLALPGNSWDLQSRHTYSENVINTDSIALDEDAEYEDITIEELDSSTDD